MNTEVKTYIFKVRMWMLKKLAHGDVVMLNGKSHPDYACFVDASQSAFVNNWKFEGFVNADRRPKA